MFYRLIAIVSTTILLGACQSVPSETYARDTAKTWLDDPAYFRDRYNEIERQSIWRYSAKVGLSTPRLNEQVNLVWNYRDQTNNIRLFGPLGVGATNLQFDDYGVVLSDNKGKEYRGDNAEELLTRIVGWPIPIDALSSWVFGLPEKNSTFRYTLDENQRVKRLEQLGWNIEYSDYKEYPRGSMPRKIVATKHLTSELIDDHSSQYQALASNNVIVKLITKTWK